MKGKIFALFAKLSCFALLLVLPTLAAADDATPDVTAPTIKGVVLPLTGTYALGASVDYKVNYTENLIIDTASGKPYLTLYLGSTEVHALLASADTSTLTFRYTVALGDEDDDVELPIEPVTITLNGGTIKDAAGNDAALSYPGRVMERLIAVDGVLPVITNASVVSGSKTYGVGDTITLRVVFDDAVIVSGTPSIELTIGDAVRKAAYAAGNKDTLLFHYVVEGDDEDTVGVEVGGVISLNGGTIKDSTGNDAELYFELPEAPSVIVKTKTESVYSLIPVDVESSLTYEKSTGVFRVKLPAGAHSAEILLFDALGHRLADKMLSVTELQFDLLLPVVPGLQFAVLRVNGSVRAVTRVGVPLR